MKMERHQGPLPHPDILARYEEILPGTAERILSAFETQTAHRIDLERTVIGADVLHARLGLFVGAAVCLAIAAGGFIVIGLGHDLAGGGVLGVDLASIVGTFVYGSRARQREREQQREDPS